MTGRYRLHEVCGEMQRIADEVFSRRRHRALERPTTYVSEWKQGLLEQEAPLEKLRLNPTREKTTTISFRISQTAFKALQEEAKKNNTSLNTLANQIFLAYAEHDRFLQKFRMVKLSTPTFKRILNAVSKEAAEDAGRKAGATIPESFISAKTGEFNSANGVLYLRLMGTYANLFDYNEFNSPRAVITLTHDLGANGSEFLAAYSESLFENAGSKVKITQFENSVRIEFP